MRELRTFSNLVVGPAKQLDRRQFMTGFGALGATLAVATSMAPRWDSVAPARPLPVVAAPHMAAPPPIHLYSETFRRDWAVFLRDYVTVDGRVLDTGNGNVSHSEGQGWALLAAQAADDQASFVRILDWTQSTLQRRPGDRLHAWLYRPTLNNPVPDLNNATDGDLFIAAALARAAQRWGRPDYAARAAAIARDVLGLVRMAGSRTVLLPGAAGFEKAGAYIINPSYYAFALFADLEPLAPSPHWDALRQDGVSMMLQSRYGRWGLPPDWVRVGRSDGALSIAQGWPPRFSYDAIRIPLHLVWGQRPAAPLLDGYTRFVQASAGKPPAWTDLVTNEVAPYFAPQGFLAVASVVLQQTTLGATLALPSVIAASDYYSAGLILLSRMAVEERNQPSA